MMRGTSSRWICRAAAVAIVALALGGCALLQPNRAPIASFTSVPDEGYRPLEVSFDATESNDPDGDRLTYAWSFGDGATGAGVRATHTYDHAGRYDVILRVTDPEGLEDGAVETVEVFDVPEGTVVVPFDWTWDGAEQHLDALLPWDLYQTYRGRLRTPFVDNYNYGAFVEDPLDDPTLEDLADELADPVGGADPAFAEYALAFVQGAIAYAADPPDVEWPLYPLETLVDGEGDCEDTAILYVSLLKARGISCQLAFVDTDGDASPDHVLALVEVDGSFAQPPGVTVFEWDGKRYAVAETASGPMDLGVDPWGLEADDLIALWPF
jgi:transglutaminase-like putative cysteine protease